MKPGNTNGDFYFVLPVLTHVIEFFTKQSLLTLSLIVKMIKIKCCIAVRQCVINIVSYFDLYGGLIYP